MHSKLGWYSTRKRVPSSSVSKLPSKSLSRTSPGRIDEVAYKYLGFEIKKGEVYRKEMMKVLEGRIKKLEEQTWRVEVFEVRNLIQFINQNVMSVVRFYSGPVKFTLGWLDRMDKTIRQHLTQQGMLMKRGMATSRLYMSPTTWALA